MIYPQAIRLVWQASISKILPPTPELLLISLMYRFLSLFPNILLKLIFAADVPMRAFPAKR